MRGPRRSSSPVGAAGSIATCLCGGVGVVGAEHQTFVYRMTFTFIRWLNSSTMGIYYIGLREPIHSQPHFLPPILRSSWEMISHTVNEVATLTLVRLCSVHERRSRSWLDYRVRSTVQSTRHFTETLFGPTPQRRRQAGTTRRPSLVNNGTTGRGQREPVSRGSAAPHYGLAAFEVPSATCRTPVIMQAAACNAPSLCSGSEARLGTGPGQSPCRGEARL